MEKKLTAEEFAEKVMAEGDELEVNELETQSIRKFEDEYRNWDELSEEEIEEMSDPDYKDPNATVVWTIYAHINIEDCSVKTENKRASDFMLTADMKLTEEQSDALFRGDEAVEQIERQTIIDEIYPQYLKLWDDSQ